MTAVLTGDVRLRMPQGREWTWAGLQEIPDDGHRYETVDGSLHVSPGPSGPRQVAAGRIRDVPFRVELRPAELVGPRRRS